jgi:hypothetical protein
MTTFSSLFDTFTDRAFRYEALPAYITDEETDAFEAYRRGDEVPTEFLDEWIEFLTEASATKRKVIRLRLVPEPSTEYYEFERIHGYSRSVQAGEQFFELRQGVLPEELRKIPDFWLFDANAVAIMHYGPDGYYEEAEVIEDAETVARFSGIAERLSSLATPMNLPHD